MRERELKRIVSKPTITTSWTDNVIGQMIRAMPRYIDDIERDFGTETYDKMLNDPFISAQFEILRGATIQDGVTLLPAFPKPIKGRSEGSSKEDYDKSMEVLDFVKAMVEELETPLEDVLFDMLSALAYGARVAEKIYEVEGGVMKLKRLEVKPRANLLPVVNTGNKLVGYVAKKVGQFSIPVPSGHIDPKDIVPVEKFATLTIKSKNGDPRGCSMLRPAYNAWWIKTNIWPNFYRYLIQFASPSIVCLINEASPDRSDYLDSDGTEVRDENGQTIQLPTEEAVRMAVQRIFEGGSVMVMRGGGGADIKTLESQGNGEAFMAGIDMLNREMVTGIMTQTRATMEALHGSKADSDAASNVMDMVINAVRRWLANMIKREVIYQIVDLNMGTEVAKKYCPRVALKSVSRPDFAKTSMGVAQLAGVGWIRPDQKPGINEDLGLPQSDMDDEEIPPGDTQGVWGRGKDVGGSGKPAQPSPPARK